MPTQELTLEPTFAGVALPLIFLAAAVFFAICAKRMPPLTYQRYAFAFLALNFFSLGCCIGADYNLIGKVPELALKISPLFFTLLYLVIGGIAKKPLIWGVGLVTPGFWFFCQKIDAAFFNLEMVHATLPQDPAWFLLVAVTLVVLMRVARMQNFWDALEQPELTASFCYGVAGLWLLSLGWTSVFAVFSLPVFVWMALLLVLSVFGFWLSKLLGDNALSLCSGLGIIALLHAIGVYLFTPAVA